MVSGGFRLSQKMASSARKIVSLQEDEKSRMPMHKQSLIKPSVLQCR
jgi:hypothetical protein